MTEDREKQTSALSAYEEGESLAIRKWNDAPPGIMAGAMATAALPVTWLVQKVVPEKSIRAALEGANKLAEQLTDGDEILREGGVTSIVELRSGELERSDKLTDSVHNWAIGIAATEGAAAGAIGLPGMAADIPVIVTLAIRTIRKIGLCYGFECKGEAETDFVLGVLPAAGANSISDKIEALLTHRTIETMLVRQTWKAIGERAAATSLSNEAGIIAIRSLAKQLGVNLTKRKALQALPAIGAGIGATMNGMFIKDVGWAARRTFQMRWLRENGKLIPDGDHAPTTASS